MTDGLKKGIRENIVYPFHFQLLRGLARKPGARSNAVWVLNNILWALAYHVAHE
jgi:hypothetical protein